MNSVLIDVSQRGEQGGADSSTHRRSEKPDEIGQWRNARCVHRHKGE